MRIHDSAKLRWEVPEDFLDDFVRDNHDLLNLRDLGFYAQQSPRGAGFEFGFIDKGETRSFVCTENRTLLFFDKYIKMGFNLRTRRIYGLGERVSSFQLSPGNYTIFPTINK